MAEGSSANYNLLAQLSEAGLKYGDVQVENLQPADALAAFSNGHLDAWAIWEPYTSQAELEADAQVITTGEGGVVNGYVFQVASNAGLEDPATTAALEDYVARIARAQEWSISHKEDWAKVWAEETGLSEDITLRGTEEARRRAGADLPRGDRVRAGDGRRVRRERAAARQVRRGAVLQRRVQRARDGEVT